MLSFLRRLTPKQYLLIGVVVMVLAGMALFYRQLDIDALHRRADGLNGFVVFAGMVVLPLLGFPVMIVHAIAGVRFGIGFGCVLVALATLLQLLSAYGLVKMAPGFFARRLAPFRARLPKTTHTPLTLFTMLLPGVPYFSQIYVLPLVGVPLGTYLAWSLPINVARSVVGVTFGDISDDLTPLRMTGFGLYFVVITSTCAWAFIRLKRKIHEHARGPGIPTPLSEPVGGWERFFRKRKEARRQRAAARR
ncbi:MAG: associated Golgi protein [Rariglobus sp.]|jgi:uncharacterized membrane protein YdjX (TVP38/TMEM64 family)|nr:associated Golgi protein [Rariglobus sp.]